MVLPPYYALFFNNFGVGADLGDQDDTREPILWKMEDSSSVQL